MFSKNVLIKEQVLREFTKFLEFVKDLENISNETLEIWGKKNLAVSALTYFFFFFFLTCLNSMTASHPSPAPREVGMEEMTLCNSYSLKIFVRIGLSTLTNKLCLLASHYRLFFLSLLGCSFLGRIKNTFFKVECVMFLHMDKPYFTDSFYVE